MFRIICRIYILLSIFPLYYKSEEKGIKQYTHCKDINNLTLIHSKTQSSEAFSSFLSGSNRIIHDIPINQTSNIVKSGKQYFCKNWAVVKAISNPTNSVRQIASDDKWCLVIVADINSQSSDEYLSALGYQSGRIVFLNAEDQDRLYSYLSTIIPWNHIGRKNVGYLFAIQNGAELIWDFDNNNQGVLDIDILKNQNTMSVLQRCTGQNKLFNPYPYFGANETYTWPRGFPLEFAREPSTAPGLCRGNISLKRVGVIQSVANTEPDVDATFRFTRNYPMIFEATKQFPFILVPQYSYCPFNERATLWTKQAFLYMALPISVHNRVSDIWRSYFAQLFFHRKGIRLLFSQPFVVQKSSVQNILEDLIAEMDMYQKSNILVDFLHTFQFNPNTTLEYLYEQLYTRGLIEWEDVNFIRLWTKSYREVSGTL